MTYRKLAALTAALVTLAAVLLAGGASGEPARTDHMTVFIAQHTDAILRLKCRAGYGYHTIGARSQWLLRHRYSHRVDSACNRYWRAADRDFHVALARASIVFGVSYVWLHKCDHSEGSDAMVWNRQGSGAFGPMQFMGGTFYNNVDDAFATARARGVRVPWRYARWDSNVGQAFTAAYMFSRWGSSGWTGAGC